MVSGPSLGFVGRCRQVKKEEVKASNQGVASVLAYIQGVVRDGGAREDSILLHETGATALGGGARGALGVVVEAGDDVPGRRALQVLGLVVGYAGLDLGLSVGRSLARGNGVGRVMERETVVEKRQKRGNLRAAS